MSLRMSAIDLFCHFYKNKTENIFKKSVKNYSIRCEHDLLFKRIEFVERSTFHSKIDKLKNESKAQNQGKTRRFSLATQNIVHQQRTYSTID